jgi:comEA protein
MTRFSKVAGLALALAVASVTFVPPVLAAKPAPSAKVNLNSASVEQLTALPGVGEKLAERIVQYRQKSGGFKSTQDLLNVQGIGEKNFAKLQTFVVTGGDRAEGKADAARNAQKAAAQ